MFKILLENYRFKSMKAPKALLIVVREVILSSLHLKESKSLRKNSDGLSIIDTITFLRKSIQ